MKIVCGWEQLQFLIQIYQIELKSHLLISKMFDQTCLSRRIAFFIKLYTSFEILRTLHWIIWEIDCITLRHFCLYKNRAQNKNYFRVSLDDAQHDKMFLFLDFLYGIFAFNWDIPVFSTWWSDDVTFNYT